MSQFNSSEQFEDCALEVTVGSPLGNAFQQMLYMHPEHKPFFDESNSFNLENFGRLACAVSAFPPSPSIFEIKMDELLKKGVIKTATSAKGKPPVVPPPPVQEPDRAFYDLVGQLGQQEINDIYAGRTVEPCPDFKRRYDLLCGMYPGY